MAFNTLSDKITENISTWDRLKGSVVGNVDHALNQLSRYELGRQSEAAQNVPWYRPLKKITTTVEEGTKMGNELADAVEKGEKQISELPNYTQNINALNHATKSEKQHMYAQIVYLNGDKPITYDDYVRMCKNEGKQPGAFLGMEESSYRQTNRIEDKKNYKGTDSGNIVTALIDAEKRMYDTPSRFRFGSYCWRMNPNGTIEFTDNFSATEPQAAIGKNDSGDYNLLRDLFFRGTQHPMTATMTLDEQNKILKDVGYIKQ